LEQEGEREIYIRNILIERGSKERICCRYGDGWKLNTILHMLAIANEAGVDFNIADINSISKRVSHIAKISPKLNNCPHAGY